MTFVTNLRRWLADQFGRILSVLYYDVLFETRWAFSGELAERVHAWELQRRKGDVPIPRTLWEQQYETGHWDYLHAIHELGRFSVIVGYIYELKPRAAVLDVGCGEGLLFKRLQPHGCGRYLGLDVSATAIERARAASGGTFFAVDAEHYTPRETYDVIVFNEVLYYFSQPLETVARYLTNLAPDGIVIVSTFPKSRRGRSILRALKRKYALADETQVSHDSESWICSVFRLGPAELARTA